MGTKSAYTAARFKALYRAILKLHRHLPTSEMRYIGTRYVRQEFRQHASLPRNAPFWVSFFEQWENYYHTLGQQFTASYQQQGKELTESRTSNSSASVETPFIDGRLGRPLTQSELEALSDEQIGQLHELQNEATKPIDKK